MAKRKQFPWNLPPEIEARLGDVSYGRQRAIFEAEHLLLILHAPPVPNNPQREFVVFLRSPAGAYSCNGVEKGETKLAKLLDDYRALFDKYDGQYENATTSDELFGVVEDLAPIARAAGHMREALQSARELVGDDKLLITMRDRAYEVSRELDLLLSDAKLALDYRIARNSEAQTAKAQEMAEAQHKLNVMAAVTFPIMAIATVFGMNLASGMEGLTPLLFWVVFGCGIAVGVFTMNWVTNGGALFADKIDGWAASSGKSVENEMRKSQRKLAKDLRTEKPPKDARQSRKSERGRTIE